LHVDQHRFPPVQSSVICTPLFKKNTRYLNNAFIFLELINQTLMAGFE